MKTVIIAAVLVVVAAIAIRYTVRHLKGEGGCCGGGGSYRAKKKKLAQVR